MIQKNSLDFPKKAYLTLCLRSFHNPPPLTPLLVVVPLTCLFYQGGVGKEDINEGGPRGWIEHPAGVSSLIWGWYP